MEGSWDFVSVQDVNVKRAKLNGKIFSYLLSLESLLSLLPLSSLLSRSRLLSPLLDLSRPLPPLLDLSLKVNLQLFSILVRMCYLNTNWPLNTKSRPNDNSCYYCYFKTYRLLSLPPSLSRSRPPPPRPPRWRSSGLSYLKFIKFRCHWFYLLSAIAYTL